MSYPHGVAPPPYSAVPVSYNVILYLSMYIPKVNTVACKQSRVVWRSFVPVNLVRLRKYKELFISFNTISLETEKKLLAQPIIL